MGFTESMTTTNEFDVSPERNENTGRRVPGRYVATNAIQVRLTALARLGEVIDAALARGATTVNDVEFSASEPDSAQQAAISNAVVQARRQAAAIAAALGGSLGPFIQATTNPASGGSMMLGSGGMAYRARLQAPTSITPSELTINASVQARWQFLQR
jgi:uncharacterized protein YggE